MVTTAAGFVMVAAGRPAPASPELIRSAVSDAAASLAEAVYAAAPTL